MAKKKLKSFNADDAGDGYTPTVKTIKGVKSPVAEASTTLDKLEKKTEDKGEKTKKKVKSVEKKQVIERIKSEDKTKKPIAHRKEEKIVQKSSNSSVQGKSSPIVKKGNVVSDLRKAKSEQSEIDSVIQLVGFKIADEEFGLEIQKVQEINRPTEITRVPRTPEYVLGVINLRGKVIPVVNMRARFGFDKKGIDKDSRIIVLELENIEIGILVDSVTEVISLPLETVESPPNLATNVETNYISGVGKLNNRLLILLDVDKVFKSVQIDKFAEAAV